MHNDTPIDSPSGEEQTSPAASKEQQAAEDRLSELKLEAERMVSAEQGLHWDLPGWRLDHELERFTEKQAHRMWLRWLDQQAWRHIENPDRYGAVRSHKGRVYAHMLAYVTEKRARLQEMREEVARLRGHDPSLAVEEMAVQIAILCDWLEGVYSETGTHYPQTFPPSKPRRLR